MNLEGSGSRSRSERACRLSLCLVIFFHNMIATLDSRILRYIHVVSTPFSCFVLLPGYSCSDLRTVCKEAAMAPVKELMLLLSAREGSRGPATSGPHDYCGNDEWDRAHSITRLRKLSAEDFSSALDVIRPTSVDQVDYAAV